MSTTPTPFQRFTEFAKRVIAVPKAEVDEQAKEWQRQKKSRKKKTRARRASMIIVSVLLAGVSATAQVPDRFALWSTSTADRNKWVDPMVFESRSLCETDIQRRAKIHLDKGLTQKGPGWFEGRTSRGDRYHVAYQCLPVGVNPK